MKSNIRSLILFSFLLSAFTGCNKHEFPRTPYPNVRTISVTEITSSGVTFTGEVTNTENSTILTHGFEWTQFEGTNPENGPNDTIGLGRMESDGQFSCKVNYSLISKHRYYVRAYVKTKDYIVFGEELVYAYK